MMELDGVYEQLYSSPSDRNAAREKNIKRNINKQQLLHNTQINESTDNSSTWPYMPTNVNNRQCYKTNKDQVSSNL